MADTLGNQDPQEVLCAAAELEAVLNTIPTIRADALGGYDAARQRHHAACAQVIADLTTRRYARATVSEGRDGWRISMLGLRASGTSGFVSAGRNWIAQARRKAQATLGTRRDA